MHRITTCLLVIATSMVSSIVLAQPMRTLDVTTTKVPSLDKGFAQLLQPNPAIRKDSMLNERIVDLVQAEEMDSMLPSRKQHHRANGMGWIIYIFGFNWTAFDIHRQKMVGTVKHDVAPPVLGSDYFTEYDVNIDLQAHLPKYLDATFKGYTQQKNFHRHYKREHKQDDFTKPPFVYPTDTTLDFYRIHCELTPPKPFRKEIDSLFYPDIAPTNFTSHPNFGEPRPTLGMYGALVSDCNHTCHPEVHPYEMLWWLDVNPKKDTAVNTKRWMIGLLHEYSNRFRGWSKRPRVGSYGVPFIFPLNEGSPTINIEHLVYSEFMPKQFKNYKKVPANAIDMNYTDLQVKLQGINKPINIHTNKAIDSEALRLWITDVQTDGQYVWGYLHLATSVKELYTARVSVSH